MSLTEIDKVIEEKLELLHEEKYKLRTFQVEILLKIQSDFGVEETLQDIRSIGGVTVVTALDSYFRKEYWILFEQDQNKIPSTEGLHSPSDICKRPLVTGDSQRRNSWMHCSPHY
jgi:hypothetical protein